MKKIELLSPAGNMNSLKAAVLAGADAIYLSGKLFGARAFADNFSNDELIEAINFCHLYKVRVYLTVNTLIYDDEIERFIEYIRFVHKNNIDAVIIQDLGMFDLIRKKFPNLEIHLSTQAHVHNLEGAILAKKLGAKRIVIARETSYEEIKKIKEQVDIEIECFIHGALCVCYSGQCQMSRLIGNRSGNRGTCSQCCRKKYNLYDENNKKMNCENYLLSMKDLNTVYELDKIIETGCDSLKIEGRLKSDKYVYLVTSLYKKVIDNYYKNKKIIVDEQDILKIKRIFNRTYTKGFILNEKKDSITNEFRSNNIGIEVGLVVAKEKNNIKIKLFDNLQVGDGIRILDTKEDKGFIINKMYLNGKVVSKACKNNIISIPFFNYVEKNSRVLLTFDSKLNKDIERIIRTSKRKVPISFKFYAKKNDNIKLEVSDGNNNIVLNSNLVASKAIKCSISKETINEQLNKCGNTIYSVCNTVIDIDDDIFINIKDINGLRREILTLLDEKRLYKIDFIEKDYYANVPNFNHVKKHAIELNSKEKINYCSDEIYVNDKNNIKSSNYILKIPRVCNYYAKSNDLVMIGDLGGIYMYNNFYTDFSFNVVNSYTVAFLHELGAKKITLSYELSETRIEFLIENYQKRYKKKPNLEIIVDSNLEAMICKFDLNKKYKIGKGYLEDEYKNRYSIESYDNYMIIRDYKKSNIYDEEELYDMGINYIRKIVN